MLCSNCSHKVRPIVVSDIDGTLGEYHDHFTGFAWMYHNYPQKLGSWNGEGEFEQWLGLTKAEYREAKLAYRQGGMKRLMPVYPYARDFALMAWRRAELWLATTRPYMRHDSTDPDTRHWLERNNVHYEHLLYDDNKYEVLAGLVDPERVVLILEDLPEQYDKAEVFFPGRVALVPRAHNRATRSDRDLATLADAAKAVTNLTEEWYDKYAR